MLVKSLERGHFHSSTQTLLFVGVNLGIYTCQLQIYKDFAICLGFGMTFMIADSASSSNLDKCSSFVSHSGVVCIRQTNVVRFRVCLWKSRAEVALYLSNSGRAVPTARSSKQTVRPNNDSSSVEVVCGHLDQGLQLMSLLLILPKRCL